jgi:uncharacterized protein (DUF111 family)
MNVAGYDSDSVVQLETNLDDMTPEQIGHATALLLEAGALDVWTTPIQMKKQRPAALLSVLCAPHEKERFADLMLTHTSAFGVRMSEHTRIKLRRDFIEVETPFGPVTVKRGFRGDTLLQCAPEYESCRAQAIRHSVPVQRVFDAARALAQSSSDQPAGAD